MSSARVDFQSLADCRVQDAESLLSDGRWDAAYYVAGYAVECAIKACIIAKLKTTFGWFPDKKFSEKCFTHDLAVLLALADLEMEMQSDADVSRNFGIVKDWDEAKRYSLGTTERRSREFLEAITDPGKGVLPWLRKFW